MSKRRQRNKRAKAVKARKAMQQKQQPKSGFTIDVDLLEKHIMQRAGEHAEAIQRVVNAGMKVLFSKETHNKIFDSIRPEDEVPLEDELGAGAVNLMKVLINESKGTMPGQAIIPAGTILLAKACEYIARTKMAKVTDQTFYEALDMFQAVMVRDAKAAEEGRQGGDMQDNNIQIGQEMAQPQQMPPQGGMLQGGV